MRSLLLGLVLAMPLLAQAQSNWWEQLGDPVLDTLVSLSLTRNGNVEAARARIDGANYQVEANRRYYLPNLSVDPAYSTQSLAPNRPLPIAAQGTRFTLNSVSVPVNVNYDLNFWLKRNLVEQARTQLNRNNVVLEQARLNLAVQTARLI